MSGILSWTSSNSSCAAVVMITQLSTGPSGPLPGRPESCKGKQVRPHHPNEKRLLPAVSRAPLVVAVGRHQAASPPERVPEVRFVGQGLRAGIDGFQHGFLDPVRDEAPVADGRFPVGVLAHDRHRRGRGNIVTTTENWDRVQTVVVCQPVRIAAQHKSSAHQEILAPIPDRRLCLKTGRAARTPSWKPPLADRMMSSVDDLLKMPGMGSKTMAAIVP